MIHIVDGRTDRILDYIPLGEFWDDWHRKSLKDTLETFDFVTFGDKRYSQHLTKRNRVIIPDDDGRLVEFIIENTRKYRDTDGSLLIEVYTVASYLELTKAKVIEPQTLANQSPSTAVAHALAGTEWLPGNIQGDGTRTFHIEQYTNPYSFTQTIATEFDVERNFRIEHDGNRVTGRFLDLIERIGQWHGREVEFAKDLAGIERKEDMSSIVTALVGLGPEQDDGTRLTVFLEDQDALQRWGRPHPQTGQLMHLVETYEPESADQDMTIERLTELTRNELEKRINSVVEYSADVVDLEKVPGLQNKVIRFGDTIKIKDLGFSPPLYLEARVHTQERSLSDPANKRVILGDFIEYTEEEVQEIWRQLQAQIAKKIEMSDVLEVTYTKPEIDAKDSSVYQDSTQYTDVVAETKKQEAIQVAAEDATQKANQAKQEAIQQSVAEAEQRVNQAKAELENEIATKVDAEWVNGQLVLKENVITKSNTAPTNPTTGQLWLDTSVVPNVLRRWDGSAWVKVTPTAAGEVGAYTKTEVDNALNSKVSITQYTADMDGVVTRLNNAESRITQNENEIATKVSQTTYNQDKTALQNDIAELETRMTNAETSITQNANQIALKANKTDVYTKTEVDNQLVNKADNSTVSAIEQRVSQAEAQLTVQADQIASKVSRTEFDDGLNNVGRWTKQYMVNTDNPLPLTEFDGSPLNALYTYEVTAKVMGTSTNTTAIAIFKSNKVGTNSGSGWTLEKIYELGTNSNHPEFFIDEQGRPSIRLYGHPQFYVVEVTHEKVVGRQNSSTVLGTRLTTAESSITQLSDQIALKVNQSQYDIDVNNLKSRMSSAESQLTIHADQIATKVERNGVISAINQTAEQIKIQASKVDLSGYVTFTNLSTPGQTTIDGGNLKTNSVTANKLNVSSLSAISANLGTVTAGTITGVTINGSTINSRLDARNYTTIANNRIHSEGEWNDTVYGLGNMYGIFDVNNGNISFEVGQVLSGTRQTSQAVKIDFTMLGMVIKSGTSGGFYINNIGAISWGDWYDSGKARGAIYADYGPDAYNTPRWGVMIESPYVNITQIIAEGNARQIAIRERDNNNKQWHIEVNNGTFSIVETNVAERLTLTTGGGLIINWMNATGDINFSNYTGRLVNDSGYGYLQTTGNEYRVTKYKSTTYIPIRAASFPSGSLAEYKQDIHVWEESALEKIRNTTIYEYKLKSEVEQGKDRWRQGLVIGDGYNTPEGVIDGDGVEQYLMNTWSWKAIQELDSKQMNHEDRISWLELENQYLKQKVSQLETRITELEAKIA
ncbi:phage tail spike protein [Geobacillus thermodenitrificans]|uniref:Phage tail spike protein n=1 Tax=Geobacillus thermodenitrificans TaxID=33940 RepID=A0ABY9QA14_GEOTD|nr:phage tail spike protein [Geobacillus thermodenitrificans]WMV75300.1 phage tail spike protein [Geobacillus thermodenitrificans]